MMAKSNDSDVKNTMQMHSQAKVEFYKTYLEKYLAILRATQYVKHINIYDVFCGKGIYDDGGKGSPVVAYDTIKAVCEKQRLEHTTEISLIVNDIDKERIGKVKEYIKKNEHSYCNVEYYNLDIDEMFKTILPKLDNSSDDTRNLIFIDPYGYKTIKRELICELMKNGKTEIILFLPISHMQRFTNAAVQDKQAVAQYEPLREFVFGFFPDPNHPIRQNPVSAKDYIKFVADALTFNNIFLTTSYYIERDKSNCFALFFMSPHIFGLEKIVEAKWELDEEAGKGFRIPERTGNLFEREFAEEAKISNGLRLKSLLEKELCRPTTSRKLHEIVVKNGFLPKHANEVLKQIQQENPKLIVKDFKTGEPLRKGAFFISHKPSKIVIIYLENEDHKDRMD
ncbi:three-Cys-motif partner protein TcmP [bacterium]|nr:three-Cys-motif partner protein TcmP [bacterium]